MPHVLRNSEKGAIGKHVLSSCLSIECNFSISGKLNMSKGKSVFMVSDIHCVWEPDISIIPLSVASSTAESICVMLAGLTHTSRVMGCLAEYVPTEVVSKAQTPSEVNA